MPKGRRPSKPKPQQLLVEGKNDRHVIWALCNQYQLPEKFSVEIPLETEGQGIETLLASLPGKLKDENLRTLGIVVDADENVAARWQAVTDRLRNIGYNKIPEKPVTGGWVYQQLELPKVGVWLMPNNRVPGMLEDFVGCLIPEGDILKEKAEVILREIEEENLNGYSLVHRPKALIHTWLAWQKEPGTPMGQAITKRVLSSNSSIAEIFIGWLRRLFD